MASPRVTRDVHDTVLAEKALRSSEGVPEGDPRLVVDPHVVPRAGGRRDGQDIDFVFVEVKRRFRLAEPGGAQSGARPGTQPTSAGSPSRGVRRGVSPRGRSGEPLSLDNLLFDPENLGRSDAQRPTSGRCGSGDDKVACTWRDVTDRYLAVRQLARSEQRFRLAMSSALKVSPWSTWIVGSSEVNPPLCAACWAARRTGCWRTASPTSFTRR